MEDAETPQAYTLIRDLPALDRPRERLRDAGAHALSSAELLAILLRVGSSKESALTQATRLLHHFDGLQGLWRASFTQLCNEKGLGEAKTAQIKAALELGMRLANDTPEVRVPIRSPEELVAPLLTEMSLLDQEHVRIALLDVRNHVLSISTAYIGSAHTTHVRVGDLLSDAVRDKAAAMVLIHNHPSGDPAPSSADGKITRDVFQGAKMLGIELLDHLIIGGGQYISMKSYGLGFPKDSRRL